MNVLAVLIAAAAAFDGRPLLFPLHRPPPGRDPSRPTPAVAAGRPRLRPDESPRRFRPSFFRDRRRRPDPRPDHGRSLRVSFRLGCGFSWAGFSSRRSTISTLFVSLREDGRSVAEIARRTLGEQGFHLFIAFTLIMIVLVTSSFLSATSISLTSLWPLEKIGVREGEPS